MESERRRVNRNAASRFPWRGSKRRTLMVRKLAYSVSQREHWISAAGGLVGMLAVLWISHVLLNVQGAVVTVASMGASAVLLFAAPHGALSQPWPVVGGHVISAIIGVACANWLGQDSVLAASTAVALSIAAMYGTRSLHPPGGATALLAVMGGDSVYSLGYGYVFSPVLLNVLLMLAVAVAFNYPFPWRRYPQCWHRSLLERDARASPVHAAEEKTMIPHSDLVYALSQIDTFVDVSEEDLQRIYALAMGHPHSAPEQPASALASQTTN